MQRNIILNKEKSYICKQFANKHYILPITNKNSAYLYELNELGAFLYSLFNGKRDLQEILDAASAQYETTKSICLSRRGIEKYIQKLIQLELLYTKFTGAAASIKIKKGENHGKKTKNK